MYPSEVARTEFVTIAAKHSLYFLGHNIRKMFSLNGFFGFLNILGVRTNGEKIQKRCFSPLEKIFLARKKKLWNAPGENRVRQSVVSHNT